MFACDWEVVATGRVTLAAAAPSGQVYWDEGSPETCTNLAMFKEAIEAGTVNDETLVWCEAA